jgi:enterochelin esterase-like enzyme
MREDIGGLQFSLQQNEIVANGQTLGGGLALFAALAMLTAFFNGSLICHSGYSWD